MQEVTDVPVRLVGDEAVAAAAGARTTPGCDQRTVVLDLGGGTIDVIAETSATAAGSGDLLTTCIAALVEVSTGTAEWIKRGPAMRIETPSTASMETAAQDFLPDAVPGTLVGWLVAPGPAGPLPFSRDITLTDWRQLRRAVKEAVIERNVRRVLGTFDLDSRAVVAVGGPAGDREILDSLGACLPGMRLGRGDVAQVLGHRYAVAYGLILLASRGIGGE